MPYANPEIYGAPETWHDCYYGGGSTQPWAALLHGEKAKVPTWALTNPDDTPTYINSQLRSAVNDNKLSPTTPIDNSICAVGQGTASPFRQFTIFRCEATAEHPNGEILQVGHAYTGANYNDNNIVNTFWYEANCTSSAGIYGNGAFSRGKLQIRDGATITQGIDQRIWSPTGVNSHGTNKQNGNFYIAPFVYYGTRSYILQILVWVTNADYDDDFYPSGVPSGKWRTLDDWKNNYPNKAIVACLLAPRSISSYNSSTGNIGYFRVNYESQQYRKIASGILDTMKFEFDDGTTLPDLTAYGLFSANSNSDIGVALFNEMSFYKWSDTLQSIGIVNSYIASYVRSNGTFMTPYIPYSDEIYEWIMSACACFGMAFTPAKGKTADASYCVFNQDFTDEDLCLPIIDSRGVAQGDYSRGAANLQNSYYYLKSVFDYEPIIPYYEDRPNQISVYDINEPQNGFEHNGLAILMPMECISDKEEQGRWDLTLVHPIDDYGKWTYIIIQNVLKVNGQLFRIDETEIYQDAEQAYVTAHAKHITYDLYDRFVDELTGEAATANEYIYQVIQRSQEMLPTHQPEPNEYFFSVSSNITGPIIKNVRDQTVIGALFGDDNSLASRYGGHLYRDNFRISINTTQEGAPTAPAFKLRFGTDLTKISYKIDCSEWITELICKDNFGDVWAISYTGSTWIIHHQKTRIIHFTYDPNTPDPYDCLTKDGFAYWQTVSTPTVSIEVSVANLKNDPKYKDFVDLQNLDVGYEGNVYIEQYGIDVNLKIVSIRRDELTGEALQVVLGTSRGSFIRSPVMSQTIVANGTVLGKQEAEMQAMKEKVDDISLNQMRYWRGMKIFKWEDAQNYTWEEIINGRTNDTL